MHLEHQIEEYGRYALEGLKHPFSTACWTPTSNRLIGELASYASNGDELIMEIGSGSGRLIHKLLANGHTGRIGAVELNGGFCDFMHKTIDPDANVEIVHGRAEDLLKHRDKIFGKDVLVDKVYASLPFSIMQKTRKQIITSVRDILSENGEFIVFIYRDIREVLKEDFDVVDCHNMKNHWYSLWPYTIHRAQKFRSVIPMNDVVAKGEIQTSSLFLGKNGGFNGGI